MPVVHALFVDSPVSAAAYQALAPRHRDLAHVGGGGRHIPGRGLRDERCRLPRLSGQDALWRLGRGRMPSLRHYRPPLLASGPGTLEMRLLRPHLQRDFGNLVHAPQDAAQAAHLEHAALGQLGPASARAGAVVDFERVLLHTSQNRRFQRSPS